MALRLGRPTLQIVRRAPMDDVMARATSAAPPRRNGLLGNLVVVAIAVVAGSAAAHNAGVVDIPLLPDVASPDRAEVTGWTTTPDGAERSVLGDGPSTSSTATEAQGENAAATGPSAPGGAGATRNTDGLGASNGTPAGPGGAAGGSASTGTNASANSGSTSGGVTNGVGSTTTTTPGPGASLGMLRFVDRSHPNASDANPGTSEDAPWKTVVHAARTVRAGQTVYVKAGEYADGEVRLTHSGSPGARIVLAAYPGHERRAVIQGAGFMSVGNSHVELRGLMFRNTPHAGIRFEGPEDASRPPARDIVITGNHTHDTCSSGISIWGVDWGTDPGDYDNIRDVVISNNLLELGTNGCKNEIITVANGAVNVDVRSNTIRLGDPRMEGGDEGIDFKEGVRDSRIHHNTIHGLSDKAIYIDGGSADRNGTRLANDQPFVRNIDIYANHIHDLPSAGISIVTEGKGDVDGISVFNNVIHDVDGDGILVYDHPGGRAAGGTVRNVHIVNNTAHRAGLRHSGHGGIRVNHPRATGVVIRNNIAWNNNGYDIRGEAETTIDHNLCREAHCETTVDPSFQNPGGDDFRLRDDSPAIDAGGGALAPSTDRAGRPRPSGGGVDLGAHESS